MRYRVEPYVVAADIYSTGDNTGRGGWTWYTGAAGWLYRAGLEAILGVSREGDTLLVKPCIPPDWQEYALRYTFGSTDYHIKVSRDGDASSTATGDVEQLARGAYRIRLRDTGGAVNLHLILERAPENNLAVQEEPKDSPFRSSTFAQG